MGNCIMQILIVEDSVSDALLLLAELERKGYTVVHQRVDTREGFLEALQTHSWDAIIADYVLPNFSGPEALQLLRERDSVMPFIMVSGVVGEDSAVQVMKAGANDYILKANLSRLVPALEREWDAAQNRRLQKRAEAAMQHLSAIVQSSEDAIYSKTLDSHILTWNPAAERLFGYKAHEMIGRSIVKLFPLNRRDEMLDSLASVRRGETISLRDTERVHQRGHIIAVSVIVSPIKNLDGEVIGASGIARNNSRQRQAESERQQLIEDLTAAANHLSKLNGLLPACSACNRIRDDKNYWDEVRACITGNAGNKLPGSLCPECAEMYERQLDFKDKLAVNGLTVNGRMTVGSH